MPAYASVETANIPIIRPPASVGVFRYRPDGSPPFEFLPNVRVLHIQFREGADAGTARFQYVFDDRGTPSVPHSFQEVMSVDASLPGVVSNDERLVVLSANPDGSHQVLFDGFAQVPELGLSPDREMVTFLAFGVAIREWDTPIGGALMRDADDPGVVSDVETDLLTHFNPQGMPNATPEGADAVSDSGQSHPSFLDPLVVRSPDVRRHWSLPMAARYLCFRHNPGEAYVANPDGGHLYAILDSRKPGVGASFLPDDPGSTASEPIVVPDYPATGKAWPNVLRDLLDPHGFGMAFRVETTGDGRPRTALDIYRRQDGSDATYKDLYLQARGSTLDPGQTNIGEAKLTRDTRGIANAYVVESGLVRYEASFILTPGFAIAASDAQTAASIVAYDRNGPSFSSANRDKYRLYVLDETGEGHWDWKTSRMVRTPPSLRDLFLQDPESDGSYVKRRRIPIGELFSVDSNRKPLKAQLSISTDYAGTQPGLWDGTGTWQPIGSGYELLRDRLGIWINAPNPNAWNIQGSKAGNAPYPAGIVKGVEDQAAGAGKRFTLRLTCVIEGDRLASATADRRPSSPVTYTITRRVDARDRYAKHLIAARSEFHPGSEPEPARDDSNDALAEAAARRLAGEAGEVAGFVTIPRFTQAYRIGDRICSIQGRNLSLKTNAGAPNEEGEVFPTVVGLTWSFEGKQQTVLQLSDHKGA
ncbi:hypothetical protein TA3x_002292 [Tundrisphaera sp. TA3]|uniref:hypothetical protein n=1 Tax=Tundrisphaera sp. TA3 TaxID=3435775 RepID=UPI003EBF93B0